MISITRSSAIAERAVKRLKNLSYEDRLCKLGLTILAERRLRRGVNETYKIITGKEKIKKKDFLELSDTG